MEIQVNTASQGTWKELRSLAGSVNDGPLPAAVRLLDASTPVPNCRASEVVMAVWAQRHLPADISTDIAMAGTVGEYAPEWDAALLDNAALEPWFRFYDNIGYIKSDRLRPFAPFGLIPGISRTVTSKRLERIHEATDMLCVDASREKVSVVDFLSVVPVSFGSVLETVPSDKSLGRFPCPACSVGTTPAYHAVRRHDHTSEFDITCIRSKRVMKCKGARAWTKRVHGDTDITTLTRDTGFVLNAMAAFNVIDRTVSPDHGIVMRDYSEPRGVTEFTHALWKKRLRISTRLTIRDGEGHDVSWRAFRDALQSEPSPLAETLEKVPVLSDGRTVSIVV